MGVRVLATGGGSLAAAAVGSTGDLAGTLATAQPASTPGAAAPAVNTAAVVTFTGVAGQKVRVTSLTYSFGGTAPAASSTATVTDGTTTLTHYLPPALGATAIPMPPGGVAFAAGATVTITLPAAGAATSGAVAASRLIA